MSGAIFEVGEDGGRRRIGARKLQIEVEVATPADPNRGGWTPVGADGRYRLTGVPDRRFVKITFVDTDVPHRLCATNTVTNGDTELDVLVYSPGAPLPSPTLRGQVYKNVAGQRLAVAGADVYFRTRAYGADAVDFADANGRFILCGLPPGSGELYMFCANDVQPYRRPVNIPVETVIDIDASAFHECLWVGLSR